MGAMWGVGGGRCLLLNLADRDYKVVGGTYSSVNPGFIVATSSYYTYSSHPWLLALLLHPELVTAQAKPSPVVWSPGSNCAFLE